MTTRWKSETDYFREVDRRFQDLENIAKFGAYDPYYPEPWREFGTPNNPPFVGTWVNYSAGFDTAGFRREAGGIVRLKGIVKLGTIPSTIATLPVAYRPPLDKMFATWAGAAAARVDIQADGDIQAQSGANSFFSLEGIVFVIA